MNIFDQNDFSTETKNQIVFDYIANSSSKFLIERLEHSKDYLDSADQIIDLVSKVNTEKHLVKVNSFFQSEKYFQHISNEIRKDFTFHDEHLDPCKEMIESVEGEPIMLHVRRGDPNLTDSRGFKWSYNRKTSNLLNLYVSL